MSLNCALLMGRLTKKPELETSSNGKEYLRFSIAIDRAYSKKEEKTTDFINCIAFGKSAVFISTYFNKGDMIAIRGRLVTSSYTDKDGNNRSSMDVAVDEVSFCGSKSRSASTATPASATAPAARPDLNIEADDGDDDSLPF